MTASSRRREISTVVTAVVVAGLVTLVREPALGLAVLAGAGAAAMVRSRGRTLFAGMVALLGAVAVALGVRRADVLLVIGGVGVIAAAGVAGWRSRHWPAARSSSRGVEPASNGDASARVTWEALDRGEDPTV